MGKLSIANLKKTIYYLQRNGLKNTWNAAWERLSDTQKYQFTPISEEEKEKLRRQAVEKIAEAESKGKMIPYFSILVPAFQTNPVFLWELVQSLHEQVYPRWELLLLDASEDGVVRKTLREICLAMDLPLYNGCEGMELPYFASETLFGKEPGLSQREFEKEPGLSQGEFGKETGLPQGGFQRPEENVDSEEPWQRVEQSTVRYISLSGNNGISENTNAGIPYIQGNYVGLLDHDDVLVPEALYEMAKEIWQRADEGEEGETPYLLYSDEDKWDGEGSYYEPNHKEDFNLDLLLSNNYICHFTVMEKELFCALGLRKEYDGAQDFDLVLRAVTKLMEMGRNPETVICHIPMVLYHWRCHSASTAENPHSKSYAYEAGKRAVQDFANKQGWKTVVRDLKHVGFYRLEFDEGAQDRDGAGEAVKQVCDPLEILRQRQDLGAVGGKLVSGGILAGGRMARDGSIYYEGLKEGYSGYLHRAVLTQDAEAVDLRCIAVQEEFWPLFEQIVGVPYMMGEDERNAGFDAKLLPEGADLKELSVKFCEALTQQGKRILWDPNWSVNL